ncbi:MAG: hypothetical protein QOE28_114 [Solirubrobacteraceae bacterium]|nr:hypothetical protein [Solirubrobacteraceae bacterium]
MLDMARAARKLDRSLSKTLEIAGHSQGGHAALWAASLAPSWTPEEKLRATVAFAPASHLEEQGRILPSLNSSLGNLGAFAGLVVRAVDVQHPDQGIGSLLSDKAAALYPHTLDLCLGELGKPDSFGGLKGNEFFKSDANLDPFFADVAAGDPEGLTIKTPVLVEQGAADTTVLPPFTEQLVKEYKGRGNPVTYKTYKGVSHGGIVVSAAKDSTAFLKKRR